MNPDQFSTNNRPVPEDVLRDAAQKCVTDDTKSDENHIGSDTKPPERGVEKPSPDDLNRRVEEAVTTHGHLQKAAARLEEEAKKTVDVSVTPKGAIRRNSPCPCGSGLKFKKCCLQKVRDGERPPIPRKLVREHMKGEK